MFLKQLEALGIPADLVPKASLAKMLEVMSVSASHASKA